MDVGWAGASDNLFLHAPTILALSTLSQDMMLLAQKGYGDPANGLQVRILRTMAIVDTHRRQMGDMLAEAESIGELDRLGKANAILNTAIQQLSGHAEDSFWLPKTGANQRHCARFG